MAALVTESLLCFGSVRTGAATAKFNAPCQWYSSAIRPVSPLPSSFQNALPAPWRVTVTVRCETADAPAGDKSKTDANAQAIARWATSRTDVSYGRQTSGR